MRDKDGGATSVARSRASSPRRRASYDQPQHELSPARDGPGSTHARCSKSAGDGLDQAACIDHRGSAVLDHRVDRRSRSAESRVIMEALLHYPLSLDRPEITAPPICVFPLKPLHSLACAWADLRSGL